MSLFYAGWSWSRARPLCVLPASQWSKRWFTLLLQPLLCLSLSPCQSSRHWSLCQARWPTVFSALPNSLLSLSFVPGKGLDPTRCRYVCCLLHMDLPCTKPCLHVCQCVSVWVGKWTCMSTLCVYVFLTLCLTSSVFTFMNRCMQFFADSPRCTAVYLNCCTSGSLSILWCFLRSSLCCRSITGSCFIPERVRVHLVPVWIGLQGNEWLSLLLKDGLRGIKHPSFASFLTLRSKKVFFSFFLVWFITQVSFIHPHRCRVFI